MIPKYLPITLCPVTSNSESMLSSFLKEFNEFLNLADGFYWGIYPIHNLGMQKVSIEHYSSALSTDHHL
jgi:hypothetical protein